MEFKDKLYIDLFFKRLAELIEEDIDIYLLGGCALILLGASRTSLDVTFLIGKFSIEAEELLAVFAKALHRSVKSEKNFLFRKQVESFIKTYSNRSVGIHKV